MLTKFLKFKIEFGDWSCLNRGDSLLHSLAFEGSLAWGILAHGAKTTHFSTT